MGVAADKGALLAVEVQLRGAGGGGGSGGCGAVAVVRCRGVQMALPASPAWWWLWEGGPTTRQVGSSNRRKAVGFVPLQRPLNCRNVRGRQGSSLCDRQWGGHCMRRGAPAGSSAPQKLGLCLMKAPRGKMVGPKPCVPNALSS